MITKEQFKAYEDVRESGVTNMFSVANVSDLSGLTKNQVFEIMGNYDELKIKFN